MDWRLQIIKKATMGRIPFGTTLRSLKRRMFGYTPDPRNLQYTLENLQTMKEQLQALGRTFSSSTVLEIGSGWFPTIPIMLAIDGARHVYMTDLTPNMDDVTFKTTLQYLQDALPNEARLATVQNRNDLPLTYLAPFNVDDIPDKSLDFIISRTVLEHIAPDQIVSFMRSLQPKLAENGLMVHLVDHSDHLEFADKSISRINFLTWGPKRHAVFNWLMKDGENRLRHHEYSALFERAGLRIIQESASIHEPTRQRAQSLKLAAPYSAMSPEQLAVLTSVFILGKA